MSDGSVRTAIQQLAGVHLEDKVSFADCEVVSVDKAKRMCSVIQLDGHTANAFPCRLMSSVDDGILIVPTVGSIVTVLLSDFVNPIIFQYSEVDEIIFRGGDLGGLVKVISLTSKLNNLENLVNDLISKFNSHTHNVTAVGSPTGPNLAPETQTLTPTVRGDIENVKIKHG